MIPYAVEKLRNSVKNRKFALLPFEKVFLRSQHEQIILDQKVERSINHCRLPLKINGQAILKNYCEVKVVSYGPFIKFKPEDLLIPTFFDGINIRLQTDNQTTVINKGDYFFIDLWEFDR